MVKLIFQFLLMVSMVNIGWGQNYQLISFNIRYDNKNDGLNGWGHRQDDIAHYIENVSRKILEINSEQLPVVLMGDFNATPDKDPIAIFDEYMDDGLKISKQPPSGPVGTFNGFRNETENRRIDYIFTSKFSVDSYSHEDVRTKQNRYLSDHLPILIRVKQD